jgi:uncharacterized membrane protein
MSVSPSEILVPGVILMALDFVFLYFSSSRSLPVYQSIQGSPVVFNYAAAGACYLVMLLGFYYFIIREKRSPFDAFLLGLFVYGVYDMTTLAVFKKYTLDVAIIDMIWGGVLFGSTAWIYQWIRGKNI